MPYNGSGTFNLYTPGNPVVDGTDITVTWANFTLSDLATGLSTALTKDGQTTPTANLPMGTYKLTGLGAGNSNGDSVRWQQTSASVMTTAGDMVYASAANTVARLANGVETLIPTCGRVTLSTGVPVTTSNVTGATTVYFTPYKGNAVSLYNGTNWIPYVFTELSQTTADTTKSPAAVANNSNYDLFVWSDSGTLRCTRGPAWTSDTARGTGAATTELELLEGRYVNKVDITNGPAAQRGLYVGTIRSDGSAQINDSLTKRHVWNYLNRVSRPVVVNDATATWTYSTAAFRQANGSTANQIAVVIGLQEEPVSVTCSHSAVGPDATQRQFFSGIGIDSSTVNSATGGTIQGATSAIQVSANCVYTGFPGLGSHEIRWLEKADGTATWTWYGNGGGTNFQSGLSGHVFA